jgi:glycosyltransferase involved in cell wall biosynthesis
MERQVRELRVELDAVRLANQQLHARWGRLAEPWFLLQTVAQLARGRWRDVLARMGSGTFRGPNVFGPNFVPYRVRQRYPTEPNRPRVLHAIGNFYTGGSARLVVDLIEHLGHRYEQEIVARDVPSVSCYEGVKLHARPSFHGRRDALALLKKMRPDLLHVHFLGKDGNRDWQWCRHLIDAAHEHGCRVVENVNIPVPPYVGEAVSHYVFVSDYVRRRFGRLDTHNVTIYPGSDLEAFTPSVGATVSDDVVGMVCRLEPDKLDLTSIDVFIEVLRRRAGTRALIVGGGRFLPDYRRRVENEGLSQAVTFTDYVAYEDLPALYSQMSVFVSPVHTESFGHVSPLAMAMQLPVVAYAVGALPEIVGDDSLLAPPADHVRLAEVIIHLLDDRPRRLAIGEANRRRAAQLFSLDAMVRETAKIYDELVTRPTS